MKWRDGVQKPASARTSPFMALSHWLARHSVPLSPEQIAPAEGGRAAVATVTALFPALYWHDATLVWASFVAFWSCLLEPGGTRREELRILGSLTVVGAVLAGVTVWIAAGPLWMVLSWLALAGIGVGLGRVFSATTALLCALLGCTMAAGVGFPTHDPLVALKVVAAYLAGGVWAMVLCLLLWPLHPYAPARRAVAQCYRLLTVMTGELAAGRLRETLHRQTVRTAIERARAVTLQIDSGHGSAVLRGRLIASLTGAERLFTAMLAVEHLAQKRGMDFEARGILAAFSALCQEASEQVIAPVPEWLHLERHAHDLANSVRVDSGPIGALVASSARTLATISRGLLRDVYVPFDTETVRAEHRLTRVHWRHAFRLAVALVMTHLATFWSGLEYGFWALVAVVLVVQPSGHTTLIRAVERILGTIGGGALVLLARPFLPAAPEMMVADALFVVAAIAMRAVNYTMLVLFLTAQFIVVTEMIMPAHGVAWLRIVDNTLGSVVGVVCAFLVFPQHQTQDMSGLLRQSLISNFRYLASVLDEKSDMVADRFQRQAGVATTRAEFARGALPLLGGMSFVGQKYEAAHALLREIRLLSGEVTLLRFDIAAGLCRGNAELAAYWTQKADALMEGAPLAPVTAELESGRVAAALAARDWAGPV
ncbi:FUSC family protein [Neokomagataea anthophila]|uniref:FUSC family protein n=1 Tax=Neokomagataea anthophila TaxID=2826925 RepID=A0ABS5E900_9PROT|nr:FUSC family protein [Neokomagataea anthophila]MBR0559973.1 FUSC family protein [Neokomagataea anthophila]